MRGDDALVLVRILAENIFDHHYGFLDHVRYLAHVEREIKVRDALSWNKISKTVSCYLCLNEVEQSVDTSLSGLV